MRVLIIFINIFLALMSSKAQAQYRVVCGQQSLSITNNAQYNPSSPADTIIPATLNLQEYGYNRYSNIANICNAAYDGKFFIWDQDGDSIPSINGLEYEIIGPSGKNIAYGADPGNLASRFETGTAINGVRRIPMFIRVPAGQQIGTQRVSENIQYDLHRLVRDCTTIEYSRTENFRLYRHYSDCSSAYYLSYPWYRFISIDILETLSINIAGAGTSKTIDFGTLEQGETKYVNINAQANSAYLIRFESEMDGVLKLGGDKDAEMDVAYTATLDGQAVSENAPYRNTNPDGTHGMEASLPFEVTIGDTAHKRAGIYSDIITLKIENLL